MALIDLYIETERLILRPFELSDIEAAYELNLDREVSKYTGDGGVVSKQEIERRIVEHVLGDYKKYGYGRLAVEFKGESSFIGFAGLKYLDDLNEVDLGYRFAQKYWGKGIATEAGKACIKYGFKTLDLQKMIAMVLPANKGSIRVLKKLDFQFEKEFMEDGMLAHQYTLRK